MNDHSARPVDCFYSHVHDLQQRDRLKPVVLLVDHDFSIIEKLQEIVLRLGFSCRYANCAHAALQQCASVAFDMMIIDLNLKDQSGLNVVHHSKLPFMVLTEKLDNELIDVCIDSGILLSYLMKPLDDRIVIESSIKAAWANVCQHRRLKINLNNGVKTTYYVNTAKGILMERFKVTDQMALHMLHQENQRQSKKIFSVAKELVDQVNRQYCISDPVFDHYQSYLANRS